MKKQIHGAFGATHREDCSKWLWILPAQWGVTRTEKAVKNRHNTCKCCRQLNTSDFENRCGASLKKVDKSTIYCMKKLLIDHLKTIWLYTMFGNIWRSRFLEMKICWTGPSGSVLNADLCCACLPLGHLSCLPQKSAMTERLKTTLLLPQKLQESNLIKIWGLNTVI